MVRSTRSITHPDAYSVCLLACGRGRVIKGGINARRGSTPLRGWWQPPSVVWSKGMQWQICWSVYIVKRQNQFAGSTIFAPYKSYHGGGFSHHGSPEPAWVEASVPASALALFFASAKRGNPWQRIQFHKACKQNENNTGTRRPR